MRSPSISHNQLERSQGTRSHLVLRRQTADDDRIARPARRQLDDVYPFVRGVVVEVEAHLVALERNRPSDIADRQHDDFEGRNP